MIFAIVGPSGAGKDTLIAGALAARPDLRLVRRVITRPADRGAEDHEPVSEAEFARRKAAGAFALDWQAHGLCYGIPRDQLAGPGTVLFNGSRAILALAQQCLPDLRVVVVTAPPEVLGARLAARGRETADDIATRLRRADFALPDGVQAVTVINDATPELGIARFLDALQPSRG
jgi:phosphonate metabolism protein PhnN/1,5-bisphosphokinase (PRPP-forming)